MADHPDELSSLLAHYNLPVDVCNEQVSDVHLEEISSSHCKEWRRLPSHLELESIMASDIDRKQVGEGEKRREFFFGWKEREGSSATYESLIRALWKIRCRQDAGSICKLLQASTSGGGVSGATSSAAGAVELQSTATSDLQRDETVRKGQQKKLDVTVSDDAATAETTPVALTHLAVKKFLKLLSNVELRKLGLELGLKNVRLKNMMNKDCMLDDMLESWLREDDDVTETSGSPSWQSLVEALKEAGHNGVAAIIKKDIMKT